MLKLKSMIPGLKEILLPPRARRTPAHTSSRLIHALFRPLATERPSGLLDTVRRAVLFEDLDAADLRRLARIVHEREYRDGEYICEEGKPGAALFLLSKGNVEILGRGDDGREVSLVMLEPPASFEESAVLGTDAVHRFSARAHGPVSLIALGNSDLDAMSLNFPALANKVLIKLASLLAMRLQLALDAQGLLEPDQPPEPRP